MIPKRIYIKCIKPFCFLLLCFTIEFANGQIEGTSQKSNAINQSINLKSLTLKSAIIPGWGQWNKGHYFKAPIALASVSTGLYYSFLTYSTNRRYTNNVEKLLSSDYSFALPNHQSNKREIILNQIKYRRHHHAAIATTLFTYGLNILDVRIYKTKRKTTTVHEPSLAAYYSLLIPGLGQVYNKKYWKTPLVLAALGTSIYFIVENSRLYSIYKGENLLRRIGDVESIDEHHQANQELRLEFLEDQDVELIRNYYKNNMELSYLAGVLTYLLTLADAIIDAHLYSFDISDDLSKHFNPKLELATHNNQLIPMLSIGFNF